MEPAVGIEPTTFALRKHCSTAELRWPEDTSTLPAPGSIVKAVFAMPRAIFDGQRVRTGMKVAEPREREFASDDGKSCSVQSLLSRRKIEFARASCPC